MRTLTNKISIFGFLRGKQWLAYGLGSLSIGLSVIPVLISGTTRHYRFWDIMPEIPASVTIDPLSAFFILVLCMVAVPVCIFAHSYYQGRQGVRIHGVLFVLFILSLVGVLSADNSWLFLMAWEAMSLLSFGLVVFDHEQAHVRRAGFIYLAMTHLGTLFLMIAFIFMSNWMGSYQFSDWTLNGTRLYGWQQNLVFGLVLIGFGTKAGMVPFHVWLPRAHPAAPSPVSALMSAVMIKVGLYGLLRVIWDWFAGGVLWWGVVLLAAGLVTALVGALYVAIQDNLKQLLAYSSVENMGILLMSLGVAVVSSAMGNQALTLLAFAALLLHTMNHAMFKSLLFLVTGSVQHGTGTVQLNELGGLNRRMPWSAVCFLIGAAALAAVPLLNGFIGEWLLFQSLIGGTINWSTPWNGLAVIAIAGFAMVGALAAAGMVKAYGAAFLAKPRSKQAEDAHESPIAMRLGMLVLTAAVVLGGLFPAAIWSWVNRAVDRWVAVPLSGVLPALQDWKPVDSPEHAGGPVLTIPSLALVLVAVIAGMFIVVWVIYGRPRNTREETWGCGQSLTDKMEYTATSLTYPTMMFFHYFYRSEMTVKSDRLHIGRKTRVHLQVKHLIELYFYVPVVRSSIYLSHKFREIQNGSIQVYLAYIFATLLILLIVYSS